MDFILVHKFDGKVKRLVLTGQNSDTLFHVDTHAASSFSKGIILVLKWQRYTRFKTTVIYFTLYSYLKKMTIIKPYLPVLLKPTTV